MRDPSLLRDGLGRCRPDRDAGNSCPIDIAAVAADNNFAVAVAAGSSVGAAGSSFGLAQQALRSDSGRKVAEFVALPRRMFAAAVAQVCRLAGR